MLYHAVFQRFPPQSQCFQFAKSGPYVTDGSGHAVRAFGAADGMYYVLRFMAGSAIRDHAEREAADCGGFVVDVHTDSFPGEHACVVALRAHLETRTA